MKSLYDDSRSKSSCLESFSSSSLLAGILCSLLIQFFIFTLPEKSPGSCAICGKGPLGKTRPDRHSHSTLDLGLMGCRPLRRTS